MAKKHVSEIERGVGYFMGLVTNLMDVVREKEIRFEAIYRLATPAGRATLEKMVVIANTDWFFAELKPKESGLNRITVPNLSAAALIAQADERLGLERLESGYLEHDFVRDEGGKTYAVMVWKPEACISTEEVRKHFSDLGFDGNSAAFVAWVTKHKLEGYYASIPSDDSRLFLREGRLYVPLFYRDEHGLRLDLDVVTTKWVEGLSFVAFREVT